MSVCLGVFLQMCVCVCVSTNACLCARGPVREMSLTLAWLSVIRAVELCDS